MNVELLPESATTTYFQDIVGMDGAEMTTF